MGAWACKHRRMLGYLARRLATMPLVLFGITAISFAIVHLAPGDPAAVAVQMNPRITPEAIEKLRAFYGLDQPLWKQYLIWLDKLVHLDFGTSFAPDHRPVWDKIAERLPVTIGINLLAMLVIFALGVPIGVLAAARPHGAWDRATTVLVFIGFAMPSFWLGLLLMQWLGVHLRLLPISGLHALHWETLGPAERFWDLARHLVLPVLVAALGGIAGISRFMRTGMLEALAAEHTRTMRALGVPEWRVRYIYALKNALLPIITILGLSVPGLIGGSVIVEQLFSIPGMGLLFYQAVMMRDYPLVMGITVIGAVLTLLGNLLADLAYAWADPRVRKGLAR